MAGRCGAQLQPRKCLQGVAPAALAPDLRVGRRDTFGPVDNKTPSDAAAHLPQSDFLGYVTVAVASELGPLAAVGVARLQPPLPLPLPAGPRNSRRCQGQNMCGQSRRGGTARGGCSWVRSGIVIDNLKDCSASPPVAQAPLRMHHMFAGLPTLRTAGRSPQFEVSMTLSISSCQPDSR